MGENIKKKFANLVDRSIKAARSDGDYRRRRHYRLDFISENTFNRVWSLRMTRRSAIIASIVVAASGVALIVSLFMFTPLGRIVPGRLGRDARSGYTAMSLRLDSLERASRAANAYAANVAAILNGEATEDQVMSDRVPVTLPVDSLLQASEAEKAFVARYEGDESYNLSVLSPIAAQGMTFYTPVTIGPEGYTSTTAPVGVTVPLSTLTAVSTVYRGTVIQRSDDQWGRVTVVVQHPNDFISVYSGLTDALVTKGDKVVTGQRIGHAGAEAPLRLELWHNGTPLDMTEFIPF